MKIGLSFPNSEIGDDPAVIRDFVQTAEGLGFHHMSFIDHVIQSAAPEGPEFAHNYTRDVMFHEVMTLLGYVSALTQKMILAPAILILPQRQTVLVAKQAAELDVLSQGRIRLGVGIGWNAVEFDALNMNFKNRGKRMVEQIDLLRRLWTEDLVTYHGEDHHFDNAGINPPPLQRPIPIWVGALEPPAIRRAARHADGWFMYPRQDPDAAAQERISIFRQTAAEADRDPASIPINATVFVHQGAGPDEWLRHMETWQQIGASELTFRTVESGLPNIDAHLKAMRDLMESR